MFYSALDILTIVLKMTLTDFENRNIINKNNYMGYKCLGERDEVYVI